MAHWVTAGTYSPFPAIRLSEERSDWCGLILKGEVIIHQFFQFICAVAH